MYAAAFGYVSIIRASAFGALLKAAATINPKERKNEMSSSGNENIAAAKP